MDLLQKRKIHECIILGNVDRDCPVCQAHYSKGGGCCFGQRWTDGDPECEDCIHCDDCEDAMFRSQSRENRPLARQTVPNTPTNYTVSNPIQISRTMPRPVQQTYSAPVTRQTVVVPGEGVFAQVMKDSTWNGLEGFFRSIHDFFRSSRWQ